MHKYNFVFVYKTVKIRKSIILYARENFLNEDIKWVTYIKTILMTQDLVTYGITKKASIRGFLYTFVLINKDYIVNLN